MVSLRCCTVLVLVTGMVGRLSSAQTPPAPASQPPVSLEDALARAAQYSTQVQSAALSASLAKEDRLQAKAATLPSVNAFNQFIYTQGNGTPSGVFVANDGVHIYNEQAVVHEEALSLFRHGEINRAAAAEAVAKARVEIASRGLNLTVVQDYYAIVAAERRRANAQTSLGEAERFLELTQKQEAGGEVARADVVKARITLQQRQRDLQDSELVIEKAKIALGVLMFPDLRSDFSVVDNVQQAVLLPPLAEAQAKATATSPDLKAAQASIQQAAYDVNVARYAYIPSLGLDFFYGLDSNQFLARTGDRQNLGYSAMATLNIPVWNWGATRSRVRQSVIREQQAQLDLTFAQRTLQGNLAAMYKEAEAAQAQIDSLRSSAELAAESLRLTLLRYSAGEATALEVVDAQSTVTLARNAYEDGLVRYRVALDSLRTLTGSL
jgi:outer membrane protein TolC